MAKKQNNSVDNSNTEVLENVETLATETETTSQDVSVSGAVETTEQPIEINQSNLDFFNQVKADYDGMHLSWDRVAELVSEGKLIPEQFQAITGLDYDAMSAEHEQLGETQESEQHIGDKLPGTSNNLPAEVRQEDLEVLETLSQYKPVATSSEEAQENLVAAVEETVEHISHGETSLRSKNALNIADWIYWNTEGISAAGNKVIHVNVGMYKDILARVKEMIPAEDWTSSVEATIGFSVKTAIVIMAGKLQRGYFVLSKDRKAVRQNDVALPEFPKNLGEGDRVVQGVCIVSNTYAPKLYAAGPGGTRIPVDNEDTSLVLAPNAVCEALYASLWDMDGEFEHDGITGKMTKFLSGKDVVDRNKRQKDAAEKAILEQYKEGKISAEEYKEKTGKDAPAKVEAATNGSTQQQPETRETGGTQSETTSVHDTVVRELLNHDALSREDMAKLRDHYSAAMAEMAEMRRRYSQLVERTSGDVLATIGSISTVLRDTSRPVPEGYLISTINAAKEAIRRMPNNPSPELVRSVVALERFASNRVEDTPDDKAIVYDENGKPVATIENLDIVA